MNISNGMLRAHKTLRHYGVIKNYMWQNVDTTEQVHLARRIQKTKTYWPLLKSCELHKFRCGKPAVAGEARAAWQEGRKRQ